MNAILYEDFLDESAEVRETEETFFGLAPPPTTPEEQAANLATLREWSKDDAKIADLLRAIESDALDVGRVIQARGLT